MTGRWPRSRYYDRQGRPITAEEWTALLRFDELRRVAHDAVGLYEVSTIWLGLDHQWTADAPPLIFETMVFLAGDGQDDVFRYSTEQQARDGHATIVRELREADERAARERVDDAGPG